MRSRPVTQALYKALKCPLSIAARHLMGTITRVETSESVLALTFDDGPHPEYTPRLLDILDKYQAKATFFCVGKYAARYPDVIRRAAEAGHAVGNHTWDHCSFPLVKHSERHTQIRRCEQALEPYGSCLFRPPYGEQSLASRLDLLQMGYQVVAWTEEADDWELTNPDEIVARLLPKIRPGAIIVLHDRLASAIGPAFFDRTPTIEAVKRLLTILTNTYKFVTVPELSRYGRLVRDNWYCLGADAACLNQLIEDGNVPGRQYPVPSTRRCTDAHRYT